VRVFYFSGTGNSLYVARRIAGESGDNELTAIPQFLRAGETSILDEEVVIVSPIYFYCLPHLVETFIRETQFIDTRRLSVVFTAEYPNGLAIAQTTDLFREKGLTPDGLLYVKMPTNYVIKSKMLSDSAASDLIDAADRTIDRLSAAISQDRAFGGRDSRLYSLITSAKSQKERWDADFPHFDSGFRSTGACNSCGICAKSCPVENINVESKPLWDGHCEACLRCINICPKAAIQYGASTEGRKRYLNPRVTMKELMR